MKKMNTVAKFGAGAIGALALTFGATGAVGAQDADADTDPAATEDEASNDYSTRREARQARRAEKRSDVADIIGISTDDLSEARRGGQSLAQIAGDAIDEVVDYLVEQATGRVDAAVENGRLTEEEAAERLDGIEDRITERVENTERSGRKGRHGHGGYNGSHTNTSATETVDS